MSGKIKLFNTRILNLGLMIALLFGALGFMAQPAAAQSGARITIVGVQEGESVTLRAEDFPAFLEFEVLMNEIGTKGEDGIVVGTAKTDKDGVFEKKFSIPSTLRNRSRIAIRIEATNSTGWYAYNWFNNVTSGSVGIPVSGSPSASGGPIATSDQLRIVEVVEDKSVSIEVKNLPANTRFSLLFMWKNARGQYLSERAGSVTSNRNGTIDEEITIPSRLHDRRQLLLRLVAANNPNISVAAWFLNATSDEGYGAGSPTGFDDGAPFLEVEAVVEGDSVTISASNLPPRTEFRVLMGKMGSSGVRGIEVDTVKSDRNGRLSGTFDIPRSLRDHDRIAIRIESVDVKGYFAYSWFENETTP